MKLTCHIVPGAARPVYFDEAASLYSWSAYEVEVIADAFRNYVGSNATLVLSYGGTSYATVTLAYDPTRRDRRVGTLSMINSSFTTLYNLLKASAGNDQARYVTPFSFSVVMNSDGASVVSTTVNVVVMPYSSSGYADIGGSTTGSVVDTVLSGTSTNPVQNAVISQQFDNHASRITALETTSTTRGTTISTLQTTVSNHTAATNIHVTAADKAKWDGAVYLTAAQATTLRALLQAPVGQNTSFDDLYTRVNALTSFLASLLGVTATP